MNPYANIYLMVDKQHQRDLARTYRNAQRGWSHSDYPGHSEYLPVRKSRIAAALGRLRRRQAPVNPVNAMDSRVRRVHAA